MSDIVDIEPEWPHVQVYLGDDPDDLQIIDRVATALDKAGHPLVADAFAAAARGIKPAELMTLVRCMVTVI